MVDKKRLQELTKNLFQTCEVLDSISRPRLFSYKLAFISDIDSFLLVFSSDPSAQFEKTEWLPEIYLRNQKARKIFEEFSKIGGDFMDTEAESPMTLQIIEERIRKSKKWKNLLGDISKDFYEFFDLFGHWILEESDKNETYEKRRIKLEETLESIRNSIDN